jgi:hypothetical protein
VSNKEKWRKLAAALNAQPLPPDTHPVEMYDEHGNWGIAFKPNGGNPKWFVVAGPNLAVIEHRNNRTGI